MMSFSVLLDGILLIQVNRKGGGQSNYPAAESNASALRTRILAVASVPQTVSDSRSEISFVTFH